MPDGAAWPALADLDVGGANDGQGPLSRAQEQVCFLEHLEGAWRAYRSHALLRLKGSLDARALEHAIDELLARHDVLRSSFVDCGGAWRREAMTLRPTSLPLEDLSDLPLGEREATLAQRLSAELDRRFELSSPPLIRWWAARLSENEHVLLQSEHHNVHDGQSFRLMIRDLAEFYSARVEQRPVNLPAVEASYARFCQEEREWLTSVAFKSQLNDWVERLRDFAGHGHLFENRLLARERRFQGSQLRCRISSDRVRRLREVASSLGVSLFSLIFAAFGLVCGRVSAKDRFLIGTAVANRPTPDYRATVGMFVNAVAIRFEVAAQRPFRERVLAVAEELDFALARSAVPMSEIVRTLNISRALEGEAPFNSCFSFHDSMPLAPRFAGLEAKVEEGVGNGSAKFDLNVVGILNNEAQGGALDLIYEHDHDRLPRGLVESMAAAVERLLEEAIEAPQAPLEPIGLLPQPNAPTLATSCGEAAPVEEPGPSAPQDDSALSEVLELLRELTPGAALQADDDVFASGLHSLLMMQFISRFRDRFGRDLRMRDVYRLGTARRIAASLPECPVISPSEVAA